MLCGDEVEEAGGDVQDERGQAHKEQHAQHAAAHDRLQPADDGAQLEEAHHAHHLDQLQQARQARDAGRLHMVHADHMTCVHQCGRGAPGWLARRSWRPAAATAAADARAAGPTISRCPP